MNFLEYISSITRCVFDMLSCLLVVYDVNLFKLSPFRFSAEIEIIEFNLILSRSKRRLKESNKVYSIKEFQTTRKRYSV
jgi:hypothetical protein